MFGARAEAVGEKRARLERAVEDEQAGQAEVDRATRAKEEAERKVPQGGGRSGGADWVRLNKAYQSNGAGTLYSGQTGCGWARAWVGGRAGGLSCAGHDMPVSWYA